MFKELVLPRIHLRQGGVSQLKVLRGGQEGSKGWVGSDYHSWWIPCVVAGSPLKMEHTLPCVETGCFRAGRGEICPPKLLLKGIPSGHSYTHRLGSQVAMYQVS